MNTMLDPREKLRKQFLAKLSLDKQELTPIAGDFSARRYFRLRDLKNRAVMLMDDPWDGSAAAFVKVGRVLASAGASVPQIYAEDPELGLLLIEDFGDQGFNRLLEEGEAPRPLYDTATDVLISLHRTVTSATCSNAGLPHFNLARFREQVMAFADLYAPAARESRPLPPTRRAEFAKAWDEVLRKACPGGTESVLLRDYHVDNLMWLQERQGWQRAGLLDFQDAGYGPRSYDLVSLLEDARRDVPPDIVTEMLSRYQAACPDLDWPEFMLSYNILGAQRHCRILARITHVAITEKKPEKLSLLPRVTGQIQAKLKLSELKPVADWFENNLDLAEASEIILKNRG